MNFRKGSYKGQTKIVVTKSGEELLVRHGEGTYVYPNQFYKYQGQWNNGVKHGQGVLQMRDGSSYEGSFIKGEVQGFGLKRWVDGDTYNGEWHMGEMSGHGVFTYDNQDKYDGSFERNARHGEGELALKNHDVYNGHHAHDKKHGSGDYMWGDESKFVGKWVKGQRVGQGEQTLVTGEIYTGEWVGDQMHGQGKWEHKESGVVFEGEWERGQPKVAVGQLLVRTEKTSELAPPKTAAKRPPSKAKTKRGGKEEEAVPAHEEVVEMKIGPVTLIPIDNSLERDEEVEEGEVGSLLLPLKPGGEVPLLVLCAADNDKNTRKEESGRVFSITLVIPAKPESDDETDPKKKVNDEEEEAPVVGFYVEAPQRGEDGCFPDPPEDQPAPPLTMTVTRTSKAGMCILDDLVVYVGGGPLEQLYLVIEDATPAMAPELDEGEEEEECEFRENANYVEKRRYAPVFLQPISLRVMCDDAEGGKKKKKPKKKK